MPSNRYMPTPHEAALLVLRLLEELQKERENLTRARLGELTLTRLWNRPRISAEFFKEVQVWLYLAEWALFDAGTTFGIIRIDSVESWPSVSSKRIQEVLDQVAQKRFAFSDLEKLIPLESAGDSETQDVNRAVKPPRLSPAPKKPREKALAPRPSRSRLSRMPDPSE